MICKKGNRPENNNFFYNNQILKNVQKFTYLGVTLSSNDTFLQTQKSLSQQAMRALFSLNSLFDKVSLNITEKLKLFDAMISPILNYGSEVWGFHKAPDIERIHMKFLKNILLVKQQTTNATIYGELGRVPMIIIRKTRILKFWFKIMKYPNSLLYKMFSISDANGNYVNKWSIDVKHLLDELGFSYLWNSGEVTNVQLQMVISRVHDHSLQKWYSDIRNLLKFETYNLTK